MGSRIERVLIANRGEIASRIARTCRSMGLSTVAIYADPDARAPFVRDADEAVCIGSPLADASFLAIDRMVEIARRHGADAVHPGYGFLAENADFARACADAGIVFIGPRADSIGQMGRKIEAKAIAAAAGVPVIPGFSAVGLGPGETAARIDRELGYPVLLKASAGGGGKGMRIVRAPAELAVAMEAAARESKAAFGDDALLVERYFEAPRHVEIQILADHHGNLIHLFERECSIQRRHQKVIEEAPSPAVDDELRARMCEAALRIARAIDYRNAGTVELIVDSNRSFYFLEVNTRLQVEHPVTEAITGLDLVRLQILIAQGEVLPLRQEDVVARGHAVEARIYAEDPDNDFLPSTGTVRCWRPSDLAGIRYDTGIAEGSEVSIYYDPLLAKVIAHGETRIEASRRLARALAETRIHGLRTNLAFLVRTLRHPEFLAGGIDTHFIERTAVAREPEGETRRRDEQHAAAAALWLQERRRAAAPVLRHVPSGWRNNPSQPQEISFTSPQRLIHVRYQRQRDGRWDVASGDSAYQVTIERADGDSIELTIDGVRRVHRVFGAGDLCGVHSSLGLSDLVEVPRFPVHESEQIRGGCHAPMPGRVLAVRVTAGERVRRGAPLVVLEAMKMEHQIVAASDARVAEVRVNEGQQVAAGEILVVLEEEEAAAADNSRPAAEV